jgi:hypothetical protein
MTTAPLVGMSLFFDNGESYRTGKVTDLVAENVYLLAFDNMSNDSVPPHLELAGIEEMTSVTPDGSKQFSFFKTRADLDAWMEWLNSPPDSKTKVVSLVKK